MNPAESHAVLLRPLVTEKTLRGSQKRNAYTFVVRMGANKIQIRQAIESLFGVKVANVRTDVRPGKPRRVGWSVKTTPEWKRAVVTVKAGQSIDVY